MNHIAYTLNNVKASVTRCWSLHSPSGKTTLIYASTENQARPPILREGWIAVEWLNGEPVATLAYPWEADA